MAESSNLGEYKVTITASYAQFVSSMEAIANSFQSVADKMSNQAASMSSNINSQMQSMASSIKESSVMASESVKGLNSAFKEIKTDNINNSIKGFNSSVKSIPTAISAASKEISLFDSVITKMGHHLEWAFSASMLGLIFAIPAGINSVTASTDALNAKIRQNLELSNDYIGNNKKLDADMKTLTASAQTYALGFGMSVNEVQEAMQILTRRFKDVASVQYLTSVALTMSKLDFVDMKKSAQDLEAVMLQFGLNAQQTKGFLNDFTVAVHTMRITGTDLLDALERSGSAFKAFGMDTRSSIAAISALSTETARTGGTIGNTFKSIASNFDTKKAVQALQAYNISLYETNAQGMKVMRDGANIFGELQNLFTKLDDEGKRKLALSLAGGKYQVNQLMAFLTDANQNFSKAMEEMKTKSSDEMTQELLSASLETYQTKMARFRTSLQVLAQTIGNQLLPYMKSFVTFLTGTAMLIQAHSTQIVAAAKSAALLAAGYVAVKGALALWNTTEKISMALIVAKNALLVAAKTGIEGYATVTGTMTVAETVAAGATGILDAALVALSGAWDTLTASMAANPFGLVLIAIAALSLAAYELYENWDTVYNGLIDLWNALVEFVADHVEAIIIAFAPIIAIFYVLYQSWVDASNLISILWEELKGYIAQVITSILESFAPLIVAFYYVKEQWDTAISGIKSALSDALGGISKFVNAAASYFDGLVSRISSACDTIAAKIRSTFTIAQSAKLPTGGASKSEDDPYAKAEAMANAAFARMQALGTTGGGGGNIAPTIGNQIPEGGGTGRKGRTGSGRTQSAYQQAKSSYEEAVSEATYQSEAVEGKKFTYNDQLYLYNSYLSNVQKSTKENNEFLKGQFDLMTKAHKQSLDLQKAHLENELASKKIDQEDYLNEVIKVNQTIANQSLAGSVERENAEKKLTEAIQKRDAYLAKVAKEQNDINEKYLLGLQKIIDKQVEFAAKLKLITPQEKLGYQASQAETTYNIKQSKVQTGLQGTAKTGQESEMIAAYNQLLQARDTATAQASNEYILSLSKDKEATEKFVSQGVALWSSYNEQKESYDEQYYEYANRYQISYINAFSSSLESALEATFNRTKSWKENMSNIFKSLWESITKQLSTDLTSKWTKSLSQMLLRTKNTNTEMAASTTNYQFTSTNAIQQILSKTLTAETEKQTATNKTSQLAITDSNKSKSSVLSDLGTMTVQMLETMAIMYVLSALFGGSSSDSSTSTSSVNLGRSSSSYYTTPSTVQQVTVPSMDIGGSLPEDMLIMAHKNEWVLTGDQIKSLQGTNTTTNNTTSTGMKMSSAVNINAIDTRGMKEAYQQSSKEMVKTLSRQYRQFNTSGLTTT